MHSCRTGVLDYCNRLLIGLNLNFETISWVKIVVRYQIFPTELVKSPISYVDKFSKLSDSKKKKKKMKSLK